MEIGWLAQHLLRGAIFLTLALGIWTIVRRGRHGYLFWRGVFVILFIMGIASLGPSLQFVEFGGGGEKAETVAAARREEPSLATEFAPPESGKHLSPFSTGDSETKDAFGLLVTIWVIGIGFGLTRLGIGWLFAVRIVRNAKPKTVLGVPVYETGRLSVPVVFGVIQPRILVPFGFSKWPAEERSMALRHEEAHIRNHDGLWQLLGSLAVILHWPNPLAWLAFRKLEREREWAADARVVNAGCPPKRYCELLVRLAAEPLPMSAISMARRSTIPARVERILRGNSGHAAVAPLLWITLGLLAGIGLTLGVTSLFKPELDAGKTINLTTRFVEAPPPSSIEDSTEPDAQGFFTKVFRVPPNFAKNDKRSAVGRSILEDLGVAFPEGSSAVFNQAKGLLVVRNSKENIDMAETALQGYFAKLESMMKQIYVATRIITAPEGAEGFDWLARGKVGEISGVFTDPQFQVIIRSLNQTKGVDLLSAPSVIASSGKRVNLSMNEDLLIDLSAALQPDDSIDVQFDLGRSGSDDRSRVTLLEGQTVAVVGPGESGKTTIVFVTVTLIDPRDPPKEAAKENIPAPR